jgi:hypothetical protein
VASGDRLTAHHLRCPGRAAQALVRVVLACHLVRPAPGDPVARGDCDPAGRDRPAAKASPGRDWTAPRGSQETDVTEDSMRLDLLVDPADPDELFLDDPV